MHFALPPRKTSAPPPYARTAARSATNQRRQRIQYLSYLVLGVLTIYLIVKWICSVSETQDDGTIPEHSSVLLVTVLDKSTMSEDYMTMIRANRDDYAARHNYKTFYTNISTYEALIDSSPPSWTLIPALRHAFTLHPNIDYVWSLSAHALITNMTLSLHEHVFKPLPSLMQKDIAVVPPDSVIHTFSHLKPTSANLIISQDLDNLVPTSMILRNTQTIRRKTPTSPHDTWTQFFLDSWFDPLYRAYAFQKAEVHALEHIVQWHPTLLAKLVIVDQRRINSYNFQSPKGPRDPDTGVERQHDSMWREGDLVVNFKGCQDSNQRDCEKEMRGYFTRWAGEVERLDGKPPRGMTLKVPHESYRSKTKVETHELSEFEKKRIHI